MPGNRSTRPPIARFVTINFMTETTNNHYWQTLEELDPQSKVRERNRNEFPAVPDASRLSLNRRSFLQVVGFSVGAATLAGCSAPVQKAIPFVNQPVEMTPGVSNWYASTCAGCTANCGILVKVRDGRPIKIEGNPQHPLTAGGVCAVGHASLFELYNGERVRGPLAGGQSTTWQELDRQIIQQLASVKSNGGKVRILSSTITGPASKAVLQHFVNEFKDARHIIFDAVSYRGIIDAHAASHQRAVIPSYRFDRAMTIVSFDADFLGTWISPVEFAAAYAHNRKLDDGRHTMSRHIHFEPRMSLTGANADLRVRLSPSQQRVALVRLATLLGDKANSDPKARCGNSKELSLLLEAFRTHKGGPLNQEVETALHAAAEDLWDHRGTSLVICGSNDAEQQQVVNAMNHFLGNYGQTIDLESSSLQWQGNDRDMLELVREMNAGEVSALIVIQANPAYNYSQPEAFFSGAQKVPLTIALNGFLDETAAWMKFVAPPHHFLEAWDDAEPKTGLFSLTQPAIHPLFQTRAYQESLLKWIGVETSFYDLLQQQWKSEIFPRQSETKDFQEFWDVSLREGVRLVPEKKFQAPPFHSKEVARTFAGLAMNNAASAESMELVVYESLAMRDGRHAENPWLQELPDPITKITWDNYASLSPAAAAQLKLAEGDVIRISRSHLSVDLPVQIQPGLHDRVVAIALGYGRQRAGKSGTGVGRNVFPFISFSQDTFLREMQSVRLEKTGQHAEFAMTQTHYSMEGRPIVRETILAEFVKKHETDHEASEPNLWGDHSYTGHKWGMAIDLNACTGCSACLISCQTENNVPVVGKEEVRRRREMHWIRIDRYYNGGVESPQVVFQPMTCGQCDNAGCESVCPALATVHSTEGLNMQVYNRCVGTRYCANNCPFKVRRFNWFDYPHNDSLANLALNPDVTVRSRGVMEKCTFCVQRIEAGKIQSRNEQRALRDGEVQTACQQSCPTQAIVFGDLNDPHSTIAQLQNDSRKYHVLEEINLRPNIVYLTKVRNSQSGGEA